MLQWSHWATLARVCTIAVLTTQMLFCDGSRVNIARYASLNVSSTSTYLNYNYEKENVVDGIVDGTSYGGIDNCACCFCSVKEEAPTFIAQFKGHFHIDEIKIIGRQQTNNADLSYTNVYINEKVVDHVNWDSSSDTISITQSVDVQTIRIVNTRPPAQLQLIICELKIYSTACQDGYYGVGCENVCRCMEASPCDQVNGSCPGSCDYAWTGSDCSTDNNLLSRINNAVITSMTPAWKSFNSSLSIDGNYKYTNFESCQCCSVTIPSQTPWWEIDLDEQYLIKKIYVIGRKYDSGPTQSRELIIIISNYSQGSNGTQLEQQHDTPVYTYDFDQPRLFQFLRIERSIIYIMTICEVKVVEGDCSQTTFGDKCGRYCHCRDGQSCDKETGKCKTSGCNPGWIGMACDQVCPHGSFGDNCSSECHCLNGTNCGNVDGVCDNHLCAAGWLLENCSQACGDRLYGFNCSSECHCYNNTSCEKVVGRCYEGMCEAGWQSESCSEACGYRSYGMNCSSVCNCYNNTSCEKTTGVCLVGKCEAGWQSASCSEECDDRKYGLNCSSTCHCRDGTDCLKVNGTCMGGLCDAGWQGEACSKECDDRKYGLNCSSTCHCRDGTDCMKVNGTCMGGLCEAGWQGEACSKECDDRKYGLNCSSTCHCRDGTDCLKVNGTCMGGLCDAGWQREACSKECDDRKYGLNCSSTCHCRDGTDCLKVNGTCLNDLCDAGWQGESCNKECDDRKYGLNCSSTCHCRDGTDCLKVNGTCLNDLCEAGWQGESCNKECDHRHFGFDCSSVCHCNGNTSCNHTEGICKSHSCDAGYRGLSCDKECEQGKFGLNCDSTCYCSNNSTCNKETGTCNIGLCEPGWQAHSCSVECDASTFGQNCSQICYCYNKTPCFNSNGTCVEGKCEPEYTGDTCSQPLKVIQPDGNNSGAAVGAGIGVAVVVIVAVVVVAFFARRRMMQTSDKGSTNMVLHDDTRSFDTIDNPEIETHDNGQTEQHKSNQNNAFEGDENTYYNFAPQECDITLPKLWKYIHGHKQEENKLFVEEFKTLPYGLVHPYTESQKQENKKKNRYREMYAYDHSRVILEMTGPEQTDYINACHIHGFGRTTKFIASQGPMDAMVNDFWRMVWQQNVNTIVMLTNPSEAGAVKCIVYWPEEGTGVYGEVQVILEDTETFKDYIRRDLIVKMGNSERKLSQFHFKSWPDKDVPDNTWCLVQFWRAVNQDRGHDEDSPIIVHCSAGIGRTGTYIALDYLYNQMMEEGAIRPLQAVLSLREKRVNMVQTKEQYAYLHEAVADALGIGTHYVFSSQFHELYNYLSEKEPRSKLTRFARQFDIVLEILRENVGQHIKTDVDVEYANTSAGTEIDAYRPKIRKRISKHLQEMGAMFLPSFSGANTFLVGKSPTENSLVEFWSLVQEQNVKTVIALCDTSAKNYQTSCSLGADTSALKGHFSANMLQESSKKAFTERTFVFHEAGKTEEEDRTTVKVFDFTAWKTGYNTPGDALAVLDLVDVVQSWQPHISESQPLLIHCRTGTTRSGMMCLVLSELTRLKREDGQVNVLDSLIRLKQRNKELINNVEQYRFCHDVILSSIQQQQLHQQQLPQQQLDDQNIYANV